MYLNGYWIALLGATSAIVGATSVPSVGVTRFVGCSSYDNDLVASYLDSSWRRKSS